MEEEAVNTASAEPPKKDDVFLLRRTKVVLDRVVQRARDMREHIRLLEAQMEVVRIFGAISGRQFAPPDGAAMGMHPEWEAEDVARDLARVIEAHDAVEAPKSAAAATEDAEFDAFSDLFEEMSGEKALVMTKVVADDGTLKVFIRTDDLDHGELAEAIDKAIQAAVDDHEKAKKSPGDAADTKPQAEAVSSQSTVAHGGAAGDARYGAADAEFGAPDNPGV